MQTPGRMVMNNAASCSCHGLGKEAGGSAADAERLVSTESLLQKTTASVKGAQQAQRLRR